MTAWTRGSRPPVQGRYLVIEKVYRRVTFGSWRPDLGWYVGGRWIGRDAVDAWADEPAGPEWLNDGRVRPATATN